MNLLDIIEADVLKDAGGKKEARVGALGIREGSPYYTPVGTRMPTFGYPPQLTPKVQQALLAKNWRGLNQMHVRWYDEHADRWFKFGPTFWDVNNYDWTTLNKGVYFGLRK